MPLFYKLKTTSYTHGRKKSFRLAESKSSFWRWLGSVFLLFIALPLNAASQNKMTVQIIESAVRESVMTEIERISQQQNWSNHQTHLMIFVPESAKYLAKCQAPLIISSRDNQDQPLGNLKRSIHCQDGLNEWRINASVKVTLSLPVAIASNTLNRNTEITANTVKLEMRTLTRSINFVPDLSQIMGKQVSRRMRTGQIINANFVVKPPLVKKGSEVIIIAAKGTFYAKTKGVALETGAAGEQIEVKNSNSKKVIRAVVVGLNQVKTQF